MATIATFMYHEVTDDPTASGFQRRNAMPYKHTRRSFAQHLEQLARSPVRPQLVSEIDFNGTGQHLMLTFDDGGKSACYIADQLERQAGSWKGHFFIITSRIGTRHFLSAAEIRDLRSRGHVIGSHSHTHPSIFREHPFAELLTEWRVSSDRLAQLLGEPCVVGSVPGGDIAPPVLVSADLAGLRYLFTSEPLLFAQRTGSCRILGRFGVKVGTSVDYVGQLAQFRGWWRAQLMRRTKELARRSLPGLYRLWVHRRTREPMEVTT